MNDSLTEAFPKRLAAHVSRLAAVLDPKVGLDMSKPFTIGCEGEIIHIPYRIYRPPISDAGFESLAGEDKCIAACWFTRHHDGYIRERFLRSLTAFDRSWIIAYVVALCGEYIAEILEYIWEHRMLFDRDVLAAWLRENPTFYARTRRRIVSYWDCYYRGQCPLFNRYVGSKMIAFFDDCVACHGDNSTSPG